MNITEEHYEQLLGLKSPWTVVTVDVSVQNMQVDIHVDHVGEQDCCPECGKACKIYDRASKRTWRHLDTMQFTTLLHCQTPRVQCAEHGVKTVTAPWAGKHSRFTLLFEAFAVRVLQASRSIEEASKLLKLNWHQTHTIMKRAVERGLARRDQQEIPWTGMDEKSFRSGHNYISLMTDLDGQKVLDVVEGREGEAAETLIQKALNEQQRKMVCGVAVDMSASYKSAVSKHLPHADIVHDKFHISKHLNEAVDKTRRKEHRELTKKKDDRLKKTKYTWLRGMEHLSDECLEQIERLKASDLKVAKVWLPEVRKVAGMLKKNLENILTYFDCFITNAYTEGINSKIQAIKANARGFRSFENYRTGILFYCGKLEMLP